MSRAEQQPILEVRALTKYFRVGTGFSPQRLRALNDVSFSLAASEIVALVGESGSGKSTVARVIARLTPPSSGEVLLEGRNVLEAEPRRASLAYRAQVQMIFQDPFASLNPVHTIYHHLARPLVLHGKADSRDQIERQVQNLLSAVGLEPPAEFARKYPHEASGGQRQRIAIARALAVEPRVILADEPVSMLDVSIRLDVLNLMERLRDERALSFLYITHDLASARYIADRTLVMYAGSVVEGGPSEQLLRQPAHPYTQLLLSAAPNPTRSAARAADPAPRAAGAPPPLDPPGCPFSARCPRALDECARRMPEVTTLAGGHWVRCHAVSAGG